MCTSSRFITNTTRRLTTARANLTRGHGQMSAEMDKAVEASMPTTWACPAQHGAWSTLRFAESCKS
ncbi:hypothetical protein Hanom_Chr10g00950101 [Helianthus anomalus]